MIVREALDFGRANLAELVKDRALFESRLLLSHVLGCSPVDLIVDEKRRLPDEADENYRQLIDRRLKKEPVAYLLGHKEFFGFEFLVDRRVLIPRPETEGLVDGVLSWLRAERIEGGKILDLGTGSGCIAITLAKLLGNGFEVTALDRSFEALEVARENGKRLAAKNVRWVHGDMRNPDLDIGGDFRVIVSNPPYIPTDEFEALDVGIKNFEPAMALLGGDSGLDFFREIFNVWGKRLSCPGLLGIETSSEEQRVSIYKLLGENPASNSFWSTGPHLFKECLN